jgi:hypothetical protein
MKMWVLSTLMDWRIYIRRKFSEVWIAFVCTSMPPCCSRRRDPFPGGIWGTYQ